MLKMKALFKPIDEAVFKSLEDIKARPEIQKFVDEINGLNEGQQKIINHTASIFIIAFPLLITALVFWQNIQQKNHIETKEEILSLVTKTNQKKNELSLTGRNIIGPGEITSISDLQRLTRSALSSRSASPDAITISDFDQVQVSDELTQSTATLNFTELSTQDLAGLFQDFMQRQKVKVSAVQIEKNQESDSLQGSFQIYHYSKPASEQGQ